MSLPQQTFPAAYTPCLPCEPEARHGKANGSAIPESIAAPRNVPVQPRVLHEPSSPRRQHAGTLSGRLEDPRTLWPSHEGISSLGGKNVRRRAMYRALVPACVLYRRSRFSRRCFLVACSPSPLGSPLPALPGAADRSSCSSFLGALRRTEGVLIYDVKVYYRLLAFDLVLPCIPTASHSLRDVQS